MVLVEFQPSFPAVVVNSCCVSEVAAVVQLERTSVVQGKIPLTSGKSTAAPLLVGVRLHSKAPFSATLQEKMPDF